MRILGIDQFANPAALWLLLLVPLYLLWFNWYSRKKRLMVYLSYDPEAQYGLKSRRANWRFFPRAFQIMALTMMVLAFARPQSARSWQERRTQGLDIMLLLDVSASMEAQDFSPSRLEAAKSTAVSFIGERKDDRIGLILFAEDAFSYAPLTLDHDWLVRLIQSIRADLIPRQGTAIGSALAIGINRLKEVEGSGKVMVLLTDGANNRGQIGPSTAAKLAQMNGLKVYTIGIGNEAGNEEDGVTMVGLDEPLLMEIASLTGGRYFKASDLSQLSQGMAEISRLEKNEFQDLSFREVADLYPYFLLAALLMLTVSWVSMLSFIYNPLEQ
jgi:Ca-activated chloride channel family protein